MFYLFIIILFLFIYLLCSWFYFILLSVLIVFSLFSFNLLSDFFFMLSLPWLNMRELSTVSYSVVFSSPWRSGIWARSWTMHGHYEAQYRRVRRTTCPDIWLWGCRCRPPISSAFVTALCFINIVLTLLMAANGGWRIGLVCVYSWLVNRELAAFICIYLKILKVLLSWTNIFVCSQLKILSIMFSWTH